MKIIRLKNSLLFFVILIGGLILISILGVRQLSAQKVITDECADSLEKYFQFKKNYNECFSGELVDEFVPNMVGHFGITNLEEEWLNMDSLNVRYRNDSARQIFLVVYGGKTNKSGEIKERTKRLIYYLTENRHIPKEKITIINAGFREKFEFEFWLSPSDKIFPPLSPTVDVEKVKFRGKMKPLPLDLYSDL